MSQQHTRTLFVAGALLLSTVIGLPSATWSQTPKVDYDRVELRGNEGPGGDDRGRDGDGRGDKKEKKDKKNKKCPSKPCPDRDDDDKDKDDD